MKTKSTLVLATIAGCAAAATAGPADAIKSRVHTGVVNGTMSLETPAIGNTTKESRVNFMQRHKTGKIALSGEYNGRVLQNVYQMWEVSPTSPGFGELFLNVNMSGAFGACYDNNPGTACTNSFWTLGNAQNGTGRAAPTFDPGTPTDPNDDYRTTAVVDDYTAAGPIQPGINNISQMRWNYIAQNFEPYTTSTNGTPFTTTDDFTFQPNRINTLRILWWELDDNGTPTDPNDDFLNNGDGVQFNITLEGGTGGVNPVEFFVFTNQDLTGINGVDIPDAGFISYDWDDIAPGSVTNDEGVALAPGGGDQGLDARSQVDNLPIPPSALLEDLGDSDESFWVWLPGTAPVDANYDGNPNTVTIFDVISGGIANGTGVNWTFTGANVGTDFTGDSALTSNLHISFAVEVPDNTCRADLTGSADPNDPTYGTPDGDADGDDFFFYLDAFSTGNLAVCDLTGSADPNDPSFDVPDGDCDGDDFFRYLDLFQAGCP
ncbi:MAG: GC-type dockerin domain-anchored protein [Phycisphaerales bacterium JB037]